MGTLSLVATPIGNLDDITIRAIKTLFHADAILAEDTRHTGLLIAELTRRYSEQFDQDPGWKPTLIPYYDEIEEKKIPELIEKLENGYDLALVSDAGTPLISDPGYRLVRECKKRNIPVISIPGASAVLASITASGLPANTFTFLGYPPEKQSQRKKLFENILTTASLINVTYSMYCAPHKLMKTLEDMENALGNREIVIARELTKVHEEIWRGTIGEARTHFVAPQGEFVLLFRID